MRHQNSMPTYWIYNQKRLRWIEFIYCLDLRDARERFQWSYGYWPELASVMTDAEYKALGAK